MFILPKPHHMVEKDEKFRFSGFAGLFIHENAKKSGFLAAKQLQKALKRSLGIKTGLMDCFEEGKPHILLQLSACYQPQEYALSISGQSIRIEGGDEAGLYYGVQTLRQIIAQSVEFLPCVEIIDRPDYAVRGYYLDVSRGKIPKLRTLKRLVEKLAHYKINQFQLYIEHTFAFRSHPEVWAGSDALSHDDLRVLDAHCRKHYIDFVPSLNTFGHCYRIIRNQRNQHLNEFQINAMEKPYSYRDALCHYALDCRNPQTLKLIDDMVGELAPLSAGGLFNICCDETFDLGKGRNREAVEKEGAGTLYLKHLLRVVECVNRYGKRAMFWGDIILNHPELLSQLPEDITVMHWDYSADVREENCLVLSEAGLPFYVCSSVHGWRRWMHDLNTASLNISKMARYGHANGAVGFLNTDWGDAGNVNALTGSTHGMVLGAACSWHVESVNPGQFDEYDRAFSVLEYQDASARLVKLLREISTHQRVTWHDVMIWQDPADDIPENWFDPETGFPACILQIPAEVYTDSECRLQKAEEELAGCYEEIPAVRKRHREDLLLGLQGTRLMLEIGMILKKKAVPDAAVPAGDPSATADKLRWFERAFSERWHRVNRPSEYFRLKTALLTIAEQLDKVAQEGNAYDKK